MFERKSLRLKDWDYSSTGMYYVTVCTQGRKYRLGHVVDERVILSDEGKIVFDCWNNIPIHFDYVRIHEFVIMPNHMHGIIEIVDTPKNVGARHASPLLRKPLGTIVGSFKSAVTKHINETRNSPGHPVWQRSFHDHIIRNDEDLIRITKYIRENPAKWQYDEYFG